MRSSFSPGASNGKFYEPGGGRVQGDPHENGEPPPPECPGAGARRLLGKCAVGGYFIEPLPESMPLSEAAFFACSMSGSKAVMG
jgi:hypothetical protein